MCNLSLGIREEGIKEGREEGLREGRKEERTNLLKELFNDGVINEKTMKEYLSKGIDDE